MHNTDISKKPDIEQKKDVLCGEKLYNWLLGLFGSEVVTESEFMKLMRISHYQLNMLRAKGCAPEMIVLNNGTGDGRFLVADIAKWIETNRSQRRTLNPDGSAKRGRPRKNTLPILEQAMA